MKDHAPIWLNTRQAAAHVGVHPDTVRKALEAGLLHGAQGTPRGRWRIHVACLDSWAFKESCSHQITQPRTG